MTFKNSLRWPTAFLLLNSVLTLTTGDLVSSCIENYLTPNYIAPGTISIFYEHDDYYNAGSMGIEDPPKAAKDHVASALVILMKKWAIETYSTRKDPIRAMEQVKKSPHSALLIFSGGPKSFKWIVDIIASERILGPQTKVLIFIPETSMLNYTQALAHIWRRLKVLNSYALVVHKDHISFYTFLEPVDPVTEATLIMKWTNHSDTKGTLLGDRVTENVTKFRLKLMSLAQKTTLISPAQRILRTISNSLQIPFTVSNQDVQYPLSNGSHFFGYCFFLYYHLADAVCTSSFFALIPTSYASDPLPPHTVESRRWFLLKPQPETGWKTLLAKIPWEVWSCIGVTWVLNSCAVYFYYRTSHNGRPRNMIEVLIGMYALILENAPVGLGDFRRLYWLVLLYSIIITSIYKSGLITNLTSPPQHPTPKSLDEAVAEGYKLMIYETGRELFESTWVHESEAMAAAARAGQVIFYKNKSLILELGSQPRGLALSNTMAAQSDMMEFYPGKEGELEMLPESFGNYPVSIFMAPAHPLLNIFSKKQYQLIEAGLTRLWEGEFLRSVRNTFGNKVSKCERGPKKLSLDQLHVVFSLYSIFVFASLITFCLEIFIEKQLMRYLKNKCVYLFN